LRRLLQVEITPINLVNLFWVYYSSFVVKELERLTQMAKDHEVAKGKSRQEKILVELLDRGDWIAKASGITNPDRLRNMIVHSPFVLELVQKASKCSLDETLTLVRNGDLNSLQDIVRQISPLVKEDQSWQNLQAQYGKTKGEVLSNFEQLRNQRVRTILGQPQMSDQEINAQILKLREEASEYRITMKELNRKIIQAFKDGGSKDEQSTLILQRAELLAKLKPIEEILVENRYEDERSYMMQYGKGDDPRKAQK